VRVYERHEDRELLNCRDIRVQSSPAPIELNVTSIGNQPLAAHARHFVVGVLPLHGLEVLANSESNLIVCTSEWKVSAKGRAKIRDFLQRRRVLTGEAPPPVETPAPPPAPEPTPPEPSAPPETLFPDQPPSPAPVAPPPAPVPAPTPVSPPVVAPPAPVAPPAAPSAAPPAKPALPPKPPPPSAAFPDSPPPPPK